MRFFRTVRAAQMAGIHPQTLRRWEREGIVTFRRDETGCRILTDEDVKALRRVVAERRLSS